ncbi:BlaR1 family beta-lactam sensor/signal transducer [Candidatus Enterococcus ferrettii]|uniref:Bla regulator protein blaR1 n=1 Tax=Candidatus Enterococcus ferrettii TaxID=2815324 RepID=A0ABV0ERV2_9ENTE|nr:BlaR1 family beta-lactam sensor/signal transducer [Enterococcus sp. 665A]MBO1341167.1 BlaR1 family beta-lactam sensor/signal transducer [Enterococcus sp. 665A]
MTQLIERFLFNNVSMSLFLLLIALVRNVIGKQLNPRLRGFFWYFPFLSILFFIPYQPLANFKAYLHYNVGTISYFQNSWMEKANAGILDSFSPLKNEWMNDYSLSASSAFSDYMYLFVLVWVIGVGIKGFLFLFSFYNLHSWIKEGQLLQNSTIQHSLEKAQAALKYHKRVRIISSKRILTPATSGLFHPVILLPDGYCSKKSEEHLFLILMHELAHHKNKDFYQQCLFIWSTIFFWYNPLLYWMAGKAAKDREIACDQLVMSRLSETEIISYGQALLNSFVQKNNSQLIAFSDNKKLLIERIHIIADYRAKTKYWYIQILMILLITGAAFIAIPQSEGSQNASLLEEKASIEVLADTSFFKNSQNALVLYDETAEKYSIYNEKAAYQRFSPDSTYKLWSGLFGLKYDIIQPNQNQLTWDGTAYPFAAWNKDQGLQEALTNSTNWYFQLLDNRLGKASLAKEFSAINYGNSNLLGPINDYWLESSLKISATEQVQLLKKLLNNELNFSTAEIQFIKDAIKLESSPNYTLYGKTGTGRRQNQQSRGWFIGFIEAKDQTYYFACHLQGEDTSGQEAAKETLRILRERDLY